MSDQKEKVSYYRKLCNLEPLTLHMKKVALGNHLPIGLYSSLNPVSVIEPSDSKWMNISLLEDIWLCGIEAPQYFPRIGDTLDPPS